MQNAAVPNVPALLRWWGFEKPYFSVVHYISSTKQSLNSALNPTIAKRVLAAGIYCISTKLLSNICLKIPLSKCGE